MKQTTLHPAARQVHERVRRSYQCSVTAGNILHKTGTPLASWFWAIYRMSHDKKGISAVQLAREKIEREIRCYITSLRPDAARLNAMIRQHWGIESKLHWVLDIDFSEDLDRKRAGHAAQNFCILNLIVLNLRKQDKTSKHGIKGKRLKAAWNHPYLLNLQGI
jgi:predicted transposase YbfD/YdcC